MNLKFVIYFSTFIIFILSSLAHFAYSKTKIKLFMYLFSKNESVWEHKKLTIIPYIIVYSIIYLFNKDSLNSDKFFFALFVAIIICSELMPIFFYFYTNAFGVEKVWIDIMITYLSILISSVVFIHLYKYCSIKVNEVISMVMITMNILFYAIMSVKPFNLPIFKENK